MPLRFDPFHWFHIHNPHQIHSNPQVDSSSRTRRPIASRRSVAKAKAKEFGCSLRLLANYYLLLLTLTHTLCRCRYSTNLSRSCELDGRAHEQEFARTTGEFLHSLSLFVRNIRYALFFFRKTETLFCCLVQLSVLFVLWNFLFSWRTVQLLFSWFFVVLRSVFLLFFTRLVDDFAGPFLKSKIGK